MIKPELSESEDAQVQLKSLEVVVAIATAISRLYIDTDDEPFTDVEREGILRGIMSYGMAAWLAWNRIENTPARLLELQTRMVDTFDRYRAEVLHTN